VGPAFAHHAYPNRTNSVSSFLSLTVGSTEQSLPLSSLLRFLLLWLDFSQQKTKVKMGNGSIGNGILQTKYR
jgi:hypothetical protein